VQPATGSASAAGVVYAWGDNDLGELGDGTVTQQLRPVSVSLPAGITALAVSAGTSHSLALGIDGRIYAWGSDAYSQLGDGTSINSRLTQETVSLADGVTVLAVSAGPVTAWRLVGPLRRATGRR
jgi:alpha-tubulin suppressor-like RCC1 family protein